MDANVKGWAYQVLVRTGEMETLARDWWKSKLGQPRSRPIGNSLTMHTAQARPLHPSVCAPHTKIAGTERCTRAHGRVPCHCNNVRKQSVCLPTPKWVKKLGHFCTMCYPSSGGMNKQKQHISTWTNMRKCYP